MKLTKAEMETTVNFDASSATATVYTNQKSIIRLMENRVKQFPDAYRLLRVDAWGGHEYTMPARLVRFGKPSSEAQRAAGREKAVNLLKQRQKSVCNAVDDKL